MPSWQLLLNYSLMKLSNFLGQNTLSSFCVSVKQLLLLDSLSSSREILKIEQLPSITSILREKMLRKKEKNQTQIFAEIHSVHSLKFIQLPLLLCLRSTLATSSLFQNHFFQCFSGSLFFCLSPSCISYLPFPIT